MEENVKSKSGTKPKDRRQPINQENAQKISTKHQGLLKNDLSQLAPPEPFDSGLSVKKILSEANKIVKIGMEKDYALLERDNTLQNSNEMVDNLRKNILHLQMEYEKLDQNYQREISYRSELTKRMDSTREVIESVMQSSNTLAASLKQVDEDKFKIAEFYEVIYEKQKEVEEKYKQTENFLKGHNELVKNKMEELKASQDKLRSQHLDIVAQLNKKLALTNDKLKFATNENDKLQKSVQELQELKVSLQNQQHLNNSLKENERFLLQNLKKIKCQRFKYQKLWKLKKKQIDNLVNKNKLLNKSLKNAETLRDECCNLKLENEELKEKIEKHTKDLAEKLQTWELRETELIDKLSGKESEIESLKFENENLGRKMFELTQNEVAKQMELEQIQNDLSKMLSENLKLKDDVTKLNEETNSKTKIISDLQIKTNTFSADFKSKIECHKKKSEELEDLVNKLESRLLDAQKRLEYEEAQKAKVISNCNNKIEENLTLSNQKINALEKQLEDKVAYIQKLENQQNNTVLDGQKTIEKLKNQLQVESFKNKELSKDLTSVNENYQDVTKQLESAKNEISALQENLAETNALNQTLNQARSELEKNAGVLKKEMLCDKKSIEDLEQKYKKAESELSKMQKMAEENAALKTSVAELKKLQEATEAKIEAYKVVVKKLETEKVDTKNIHTEEMSKLKSELVKLEETIKKNKDTKFRLETPKKNFELTNKKEVDTTTTRPKEKTDPQKLNTKENEVNIGDIEKWRQSSTTPFQGTKKYSSTPRKIFTSTPQPGFRNLTPLQKKRDPYEFDSDSSVERIDQDQVLKAFNRQKKESSKRIRSKK